MRMEIELIQVLIDNMDLLETGLCSLVDKLVVIDKISPFEGHLLLGIIEDNIPEDYWNTDSLFYYPSGEKYRRLAYLERLKKRYL